MPYAPAVSPQAPRADMSNWGRALMQILGEKSAKEERQAEQAKQEAGEFKTLVAYGETLGLDKNSLMTKDLDSVRGIVRGLTAKQEFEKGAAELKRIMQQQESAKALEQAVRDTGRMTSAETLALKRGPINPPVVKPTPERFMQQLAANPAAVNDEQAVRFLEAMRMGENGGEQQFMPQAFDVNGIKGIVSPRTGAIHTQSNPTGLTFEQRVSLMDRSALLKEKGNLSKALPYLTGTMAEQVQGQLNAINAELGGDDAAAGAGQQANNPTAADVDYLRKHPNLKGAFENRFGAGSASRYLK